MAKTCIICGGPSGSAEHVFPAVLGGRRTNKGIYCGPHNEGFGRHVAVLAGQLDLFNASLMVRPDRRDAAKPTVVTGADGTRYELIGNQFTLAAPPNLTDDDAKAGQIQLSFSNVAQFDKWRAEQEKNGFKIEAESVGDVRPRHLTSTAGRRLTFGGNEVFQAVAYLALTYFAQHFGEEARSKGFDRLKALLALDPLQAAGAASLASAPDFVWWAPDALTAIFGVNPYEFGHTVAVGISNESRKAYAFVSFFSTLNFSIELGDVSSNASGLVTTYIDPTADRAPDDIQVIRADSFPIGFQPDVLDFDTWLDSGQTESKVHDLVEKIERKKLEFFRKDVRQDLESLADKPVKEQAEALADLYSQRILNLLKYAATHIQAHVPRPAGLPDAEYQAFFAHFAKEDASRPDGLTQDSSAYLSLAKAHFSRAFESILMNPNRSETADAIKALVTEGHGAHLLAEKIVAPVLMGTIDAWRQGRRLFD